MTITTTKTVGPEDERNQGVRERDHFRDLSDSLGEAQSNACREEEDRLIRYLMTGEIDCPFCQQPIPKERIFTPEPPNDP